VHRAHDRSPFEHRHGFRPDTGDGRRRSGGIRPSPSFIDGYRRPRVLTPNGGTYRARYGGFIARRGRRGKAGRVRSIIVRLFFSPPTPLELQRRTRGQRISDSVRRRRLRMSASPTESHAVRLHTQHDRGASFRFRRRYYFGKLQIVVRRFSRTTVPRLDPESVNFCKSVDPNETR